MVAQYSDEFGTEVIDEVKALEAEWMTQQEALDKEMISLVASDPEKASELATQESMKRAEETFARLKEIEGSMEERVAALPTDSETSDTSAGSTNSYLLLGLGVVAALGIAGLIYFQKKSKAGS